MNHYTAIGMMSGTSLDGVDVALCRFIENDGQWSFEILDALTYSYPEEWVNPLKGAHEFDALSLSLLHTSYGHYLGSLVKDFINRTQAEPVLIASHGHTIFHQPEKKMTLQIGSGAALAAETGIPVVCDFRTTDVAKGGQGAPLVPAGDQLLFGSYFYCLNLGGFANISFRKDGRRMAGDIVAVNFVLNALASKLGYPYDPGGTLARSGNLNEQLLDALNRLGFYDLAFPKSLGREWVSMNISPLVDHCDLPIADLMRTYTEHASVQISGILDQDVSHRIIATGGGVYNTFLLDLIRSRTVNPIVIPDDRTVQYKEALIFAFLGILRLREEKNCLSSVTGAGEDSCGGAVYLP
ncbi:MAG TPA: anhydro-N-acetylmuramic acid kinase [Bacteroidales bacterium]|nr:anhydro-N-acetylmuramic acid kinase [Bacteroidales bacterium]HNS47804.1 anhydro-N-acetylmuramic acid kinase [Bacteroidales bacterium]